MLAGLHGILAMAMALDAFCITEIDLSNAADMFEVMLVFLEVVSSSLDDTKDITTGDDTSVAAFVLISCTL